MAYVLAAALAVLITRYALALRRGETPRILLELPAAMVAGLIAGLWLGVASRGAMRVIALAAGAPVRWSTSGTLQVVGTFAAMGGGIAILYAGLFRHALRSSGLRFGLLLLVVTWYPLAQEATDLLARRPEPLTLMIASGAVIAAMWLPYALLVEAFTVPILHRFRRREVAPS